MDGERAEPGICLSAFLSLGLPAGEHTVEFRYTAPGLASGMILASLSVLTMILVYSKRKQT